MKNFRRGWLQSLILIFIAGMALNTVKAEESTPPAAIEFDSFASARSDLLSRIGGASKRIWISSNFLTDAEIVSSLYIAQYRKVQISVLIGKDKASHILSRLITDCP